MENEDVIYKTYLKLFPCDECKDITIHSIKKEHNFIENSITYINRCEICGDKNRFTKKLDLY